MKKIFLIVTFFIGLIAQELQVQSKTFYGDQKKGVSIFQGDVKIKKGSDELNASKVTIRVDQNNKPTKIEANGDVSFYITTQEGEHYSGEAQRVIYFPKKQEYRFYTDVSLRQLNKNKEIVGDIVILDINNSKAHAKGAEKKPVIMTFEIEEK